MLDKVTPTAGESLVIWRRRENLNQVQAAALKEVHPDIYREWEADKREKDQPRYHAGELKPNEACYLLRRRSGKLQRDVAAEMGISRLWVIQMEDGSAPVDRLLEYWKNQQ